MGKWLILLYFTENVKKGSFGGNKLGKVLLTSPTGHSSYINSPEQVKGRWRVCMGLEYFWWQLLFYYCLECIKLVTMKNLYYIIERRFAPLSKVSNTEEIESRKMTQKLLRTKSYSPPPVILEVPTTNTASQESLGFQNSSATAECFRWSLLSSLFSLKCLKKEIWQM